MVVSIAHRHYGRSAKEKSALYQAKMISLVVRSTQQARKFSKRRLTEANHDTKIVLSYSIQK